MLFGVDVSCRILFFIISYLYGGLITSVREERANLFAIVCLKLHVCGFCSERFPLPLGTSDGLRCFIAALPVPSI